MAKEETGYGDVKFLTQKLYFYKRLCYNTIWGAYEKFMEMDYGNLWYVLILQKTGKF